MDAYRRELTKHRTHVAEDKKKKQEKIARIRETLLTHKEKNGDVPCTHVHGYALDEVNNIVKVV